MRLGGMCSLGDGEAVEGNRLNGGRASGLAVGPEEEPPPQAERQRVFLDVLAVVLTHFLDGDNDPQCPSMTKLQLASLETCRMYRRVALMDLRVMADTPRYLWNRQMKAGASDGRIARPRIRDMRWHLSSHFLQKRRDKRRPSLVRAVRGLGQLLPGRRVRETAGKLVWPESLQRLTLRFDEHPQEVNKRWSFNQPLEKVAWPESLQQLRFGYVFNRPIDRTVWPESLVRLEFGYQFNQPIEGIVWPSSLQHLAFAGVFNQPIDGVDWPVSLRSLEFGPYFSQAVGDIDWPPSLELLALGGAIDKVVPRDWFWPVSSASGPLTVSNAAWPASLESLTIGSSFNDRIDQIVWPPLLRVLSLSGAFNHPIDDIAWPPLLRVLALGDAFAQPVENTVWPAWLQKLSFGFFFDEPIQQVVWPDSLELLLFGTSFNQLIEGVAWPKSMRQMDFGGVFDQKIDRVSWPPSLLILTFGNCFNQPIEGVIFPPTLKELSLSGVAIKRGNPNMYSMVDSLEAVRIPKMGQFNHPVDSVAWPDSLLKLNFGDGFDQPIERVTWPTSLRHLSLGFSFDQEMGDVRLPDSLQRLTFGRHFNKPIDKVTWPADLRHLRFGEAFCRPLQGVAEWPPRMEEMVLRVSDSNDFLGAKWPPAWYPLVGVRWPPGLRKLTLRAGVSLEGVELPQGVEVIRVDEEGDEVGGHCRKDDPTGFLRPSLE